MLNAASAVLKRAVQLDIDNKNTEALVCYQEGVDLLMQALKEEDTSKTGPYLRKKIDEYLNRAVDVKKRINLLKEQGKFHEQIEIENNSTGYSYATVFSRFLDDDVKNVFIEDPYIRAFHQLQNLVRFCELVVKKCKNLQKIVLITTKDQNNEQGNNFSVIGEDLAHRNIKLEVEYSESLHDRKITLSTGWIIKIGRGLDYFKAPDSKLSIGAFDMDLRKCHQTTIDIFHSKNVRQI